MAYMVAAFSWWAILLSHKNKAIYDLKIELQEVTDTLQRESITREYETSKKMILGEGLVFAISILISFILINKAFWNEINTNKKLSNFLLSVTHELKTPIATLNLINRTLATKKVEEIKKTELLETAYEESLRLESLINNILTAAQIENQYHFNFEPTEINAIFEKRIARFRKIFGGRTINFSTDSDEIYLDADRESIIKLVDNLIDNAIKYSNTNESVNIKTTANSDVVEFVFEDNGIGIADIEKNKILDKFYRIGNEDTRENKGTGLGLFIVKEICDAHNARLKILNNKPKGSIFKISFPKS
jgi:signal transduction histidine kinase